MWQRRASDGSAWRRHCQPEHLSNRANATCTRRHVTEQVLRPGWTTSSIDCCGCDSRDSVTTSRTQHQSPKPTFHIAIIEMRHLTLSALPFASEATAASTALAVTGGRTPRWQLTRRRQFPRCRVRHQRRSITCGDVQHQLLRQIYCFPSSLRSPERPTSILPACLPVGEAAYREQRRWPKGPTGELSQTNSPVTWASHRRVRKRRRCVATTGNETRRVMYNCTLSETF